MAERYTGRKFITQTLTGYGMPYGAHEELIFDGYMVGHVNLLTGPLSHIELDWGPVQSVTTVSTFDTDNTESIYSTSDYYLDNYDDDLEGRIVFNYDATSPNGLRYRDGWQVIYVAGYGDNASDVPADIRRAIIVLAGKLWGNRGVCSDGECLDSCGASSMLERYRLGTVLS